MRILVVDDDPRVIDAYKMSLELRDSNIDPNGAEKLGNELFGGITPDPRGHTKDLKITYVSQGLDAVDTVKAAQSLDKEFSVIFLDMRMPPGIDGRETARRIREIDQEVNIVVVTGFSDHTPLQIAKTAGPMDKLFYLAKPFETVEVQQLAESLSRRWTMDSFMRSTQKQLRRNNKELKQAKVELEASEAHCRHLALHDSLTKLPNRLAFQEHLKTKLSISKERVSVLYLDLDRFKQINDVFGHVAGDELVVKTSNEMVQALSKDAMVARIGGDEFGIVLVGKNDAEAGLIADKLVEVCSKSFSIMGHQVQASASIGIAHASGDMRDSMELTRRADLALYAAKNFRRGTWSTFTASLDESAKMRAEIDQQLRKALDQERLTLHYQPIVDCATSDAVGYEALLRWEDDLLGSMSPAIFIPVAEESGQIFEIGEWVIRRAITDCAKWPHGIVSINISPKQFKRADLADYVISELSEVGLAPERLQIELTETAILDNAEEAIACCKKVACRRRPRRS